MYFIFLKMIIHIELSTHLQPVLNSSLGCRDSKERSWVKICVAKAAMCLLAAPKYLQITPTFFIFLETIVDTNSHACLHGFTRLFETAFPHSKAASGAQTPMLLLCLKTRFSLKKGFSVARHLTHAE